jgi:late competence protein required for DNA uptake (superfamily II DNA/RNA helicase)
VAANPDDETARTALTWQLGKLLAADPELRQELEELWQQAGSVVVTTVTASGERSVAVGGNVQGSISTGDSTGVAGPRRPPPPPGTAVER